MSDDGLAAQAAQWIALDPDPITRDELQRLVDLGRNDEIHERFAGTLKFGTAGLRAPMGAGPMRMNRLVVRRAAWGIAQWVLERGGAERGVVVGCDARHNSRTFAHDSAQVLAAAGVRVHLLPNALPTPVGAFATVRYGAAAGVMVTASHNPAADNGYKVYLPDGSQIVAPIDAQIAQYIDAAPADVPLSGPDSDLISRLGAEVVDEYVCAAAAQAGQRGLGSSRPLVIAYTPLHGVGRAVLERVFAAAGLPRPVAVAEQAEPDPDFPTVAFPNPEEPGAMDAVLDLAKQIGADLALANDPDADRLAVAIPDGNRWRVLTGDEIGALLAEWVLSTTAGGDRLVVTTLVSSSLLGRIAAHAGVEYAETFTGFKWMAQAVRQRPGRRLVFAYEQALGYLPVVADVDHRPLDKDGISAAAAFVRLASRAAAVGRSVGELLQAQNDRFGRHETVERSVRCSLESGSKLIAQWRANPPSGVGPLPVTDVTWFGEAGLLRLQCGSSARLQVRVSGTEPKVKIYVETIDAPSGAALDLAVAAAAAISDYASRQ